MADRVIRIARTYFSRWRIEEYFRCKKQTYQFENFRVRKLEAINALNFYITLAMAFLAQEELSPETNALKVSIIQEADPIKDKVSFCYYRLQFLLLSAGKRHLRHTVICQRGHPALVPNKASGVPSTMP